MSDHLGTPAANAVLIARALKQALVRHPLRERDVYPTLIASRGGESVAMCDLGACWADRDHVLRDAVEVLAPDEVVLVFESFVSLTPDVEPADHPFPERFRDGDPTVSQAIEVLRMTQSGEADQVLLPYRYSGDTVVWSEVPAGPPEAAPPARLEGDLPDSLRAGFAAAGNPYELGEARAALEALGVRVRFAADSDPFLDVEPHDSCPCGSGRKYSECHDLFLNVEPSDPCPCGSNRKYSDCHGD